jgi:peptidoglycan hydrolase-like protein with peptidoglycan-binding domain
METLPLVHIETACKNSKSKARKFEYLKLKASRFLLISFLSASAFLPTFGFQQQGAQALMRCGDRGVGVVELQRRLGIFPDGVYGPQTCEAVRRFQWESGLYPNGIAGPQTLRRLGLPSYLGPDDYSYTVQRYKGVRF